MGCWGSFLGVVGTGARILCGSAYPLFGGPRHFEVNSVLALVDHLIGPGQENPIASNFAVLKVGRRIVSHE